MQRHLQFTVTEWMKSERENHFYLFISQFKVCTRTYDTASLKLTFAVNLEYIRVMNIYLFM
jgi:hypothetical protein